MSRIKPVFPVQSMTGSLAPKGTVFRKKVYRDDAGHVVAEGDIESYIIQHPRNIEKTPYSSAETRNHDLFRQASLQTVEILRRPLERAQWELRWKNQLKRGEPTAPIDKKTGARKIYKRLDAFIRTCLMRELKQNP
ncbi:MAG: hypothetical protein IJ650_01365 [Paludibacteraceae bacterium]|nr:hypothetical protein [Paludibacteraceae bacterium]